LVSCPTFSEFVLCQGGGAYLELPPRSENELSIVLVICRAASMTDMSHEPASNAAHHIIITAGDDKKVPSSLQQVDDWSCPVHGILPRTVWRTHLSKCFHTIMPLLCLLRQRQYYLGRLCLLRQRLVVQAPPRYPRMLCLQSQMHVVHGWDLRRGQPLHLSMPDSSTTSTEAARYQRIANNSEQSARCGRRQRSILFECLSTGINTGTGKSASEHYLSSSIYASLSECICRRELRKRFQFPSRAYLQLCLSCSQAFRICHTLLRQPSALQLAHACCAHHAKQGTKTPHLLMRCCYAASSIHARLLFRSLTTESTLLYCQSKQPIQLQSVKSILLMLCCQS
jgi:hypothetical protein